MPNEPTWEDTTEAVPEWDETVPVEPSAQPSLGQSLKALLFGREAAEALRETISGMVPRSVEQVAQMATPIGGSIQGIRQAAGTIRDVAKGTPIQEAVATNIPESQILAEAEKTPPLSKERFQAGFGIVGQLGMGALVGRQIGDMIYPKTPQTSTPLSDTATATTEANAALARLAEKPTKEVIPSAIEEGKIQESIQPERPRDGEGGASAETGGGGGVQPAAEVKGQAEIAVAEPKPTEAAPVPSEPVAVEASKVTSIKNAQVDAERAARGQAPLMSEAAKDFGESWNEFLAKEESTPGYTDRLIEELNPIKGKPRAINDTEVAALTHRQVELNNQFDKAANELLQAKASGDTARVAELEPVVNESLTKLNELNEVTRTAGTETGRGLNARKMLVAEDFSLSRMALKKSIAKGGETLNPIEMAEVRTQSNRINELLDKIDTRMKAAKTRTERQATEARIKTAVGEFTRPKRTVLAPDKELNLLRADLELAKREWIKGLEKDRWQRMTVFQKGRAISGKSYDAARLLMTTGEFSFILRQGKFRALGHPIKTAKVIPDTIRALRDERTAQAIYEEIVTNPEYKNFTRDKGFLTDESASLSRQEELTMGDWGQKIPIVAAFNRAARTFLNKVRFDTYVDLKNSIPPELRTPETTRQFAMLANESTGRGGLGFAEPAAVALARGFFSPRYLVSRFQLALGHSMWGGTKASRIAIAREYARSLIGLGIYYSALRTYFSLTGDKPEIDWNMKSANGGKIKFGNTVLDPLAGFAQVATYGTRTATGETKTGKGEIQSIRGENIPYGGDDWWDITGRFARTKLHPVPGSIANLFSGRDLVGNAVQPGKEGAKLFAPITYMDVYQALREQDVPTSAALGLLAFLGEGLQTRQPKQSKPEAKTTNYIE